MIATPNRTKSIKVAPAANAGVGDRVARADADATPPLDPVLDGHRLTLAQAITPPLQWPLGFDLAIDTGSLTGAARTGMPPASNLVGHLGAGAVRS